MAETTMAIRRAGPFDWWHQADRPARRAFVAASLGWMLDSFDVMLYAMVIASLIEDPAINLSLSTAGILGSVTLLAAAAGGVAGGHGGLVSAVVDARGSVAGMQAGRPHGDLCAPTAAEWVGDPPGAASVAPLSRHHEQWS